MMRQWKRHQGRLTALLAAGLLLSALTLAGPAPRVAAQPGCVSTIDLVLVLDGSESITPADFDLMRGFANSLVGHLTVSPEDAHAGIVQFAGEGQGRVEVGLTGDAAAVQGAATAMTQIVGATDIQEGIALGQGELSASGRPEAPWALIVLTDGAHNQPGDPLAEAALARDQGSEIFSIAVGPGPDLAELSAIASEPARGHVFSVDAFADLVGILEPLMQVVCPPESPDTEVVAPPGPEEPESDVLEVAALPATGHHNPPPDWQERGRPLFVQALVGVGAALLLVGASWWLRGRLGR